MKPWQAVGTIAVVALALGFALVVPTIQATSTSSTSTSTSTVTTSTESVGADGLLLKLTVNDTSITQGQSFSLSVSEYNTLARNNNVSASSAWVVQGATGSCPSEIYPFGISVFSGHYTAANATEGAPVQIFPITACPMFIRLITGYVFLPQSVNASVLPGNGTMSTAMQTSVTVGLNYTGPALGGQGRPLSPGSYTLVASDEWGSLAFLYVTVE